MNINILLRTEESQACTRAFIVSLMAIYLCGYIALYSVQNDTLRLFRIAIIYAPISLLWWHYIRHHPLPIEAAQGRILTGIFLDAAMIGLSISTSNTDHPSLYLLYLLYIWVVMGNGMRFGQHFMTNATLACLMSLAVVAVVSPQWPLSLGSTVILVAGLLMVDMLCRQMLKRMDEQAKEIMHLSHDIRSAHLGVSESGLLEKSAFVDSVQEAMASLPDGNLLAAVVIAFSGEGSERIGNPLNASTMALTARINSELRGGDLASLGRENELWMCIEPNRMSDAAAVADRVRLAFKEIVPDVIVKIGLASYPNTNTNARELFNVASRQAKMGNGKDARLGHLTLIESDT